MTVDGRQMDDTFFAKRILLPPCGAQSIELRYQNWLKVSLPTKRSIPNQKSHLIVTFILINDKSR